MNITPYKFFLSNASYNYDPKTETPQQGRRRCARALVNAEAKARNLGWCYQWILCDTTSQEFSDEKPFYPLWKCIMTTRNGEYMASLCGIDFGRNNSPDNNAYARIVEAELALEKIK